MFYSCSTPLCSAAAGLFVEMKGYRQTNNYVYIVLLGKTKKGSYKLWVNNEPVLGKLKNSK